MKNISTQAIRIETGYRAWFAMDGGKAPKFRNLHFAGIRCDGSERGAMKIEGLPEALIENVTFKNISITAKMGLSADYIKNVTLDNVEIKAENGPVMTWDNCENVVFND